MLPSMVSANSMLPVSAMSYPARDVNVTLHVADSRLNGGCLAMR